MSATPAPPPTSTDTPAPPPGASDGVHRPRPGPDDHLCTCGRVREECVRDVVRALWR